MKRNKHSGVKVLVPLRREEPDNTVLICTVEVKLLHCRECDDVVRIYLEWRTCHCQKSKGRYINDTHVQLSGPCRALGIDTGELYKKYEGTWYESDRVIRGVRV